MNPAYLLVLLRGFAIALMSINDKRNISKLNLDYFFIGFWRTFTPAILLTLPLFFLNQYPYLANTKFLMYTLVNVSGNVFCILIMYYCIRRFDVSYISIVRTSQPLIFSIVSFLILGETLSSLALIGIFLIVIGDIILEKSRLKKSEKFNLLKSGIPMIILHITIAAIITNFSKMAVLEADAPIYLWTRYVIMSVIFYLLYKFKYRKKNINKKNLQKISKKNIGPAFISGFLLLIATTCEMYSLKVLEIGKIEAVTKIDLVILLILEYFFITKKINLTRILSAIIVLFGVIMLTLT